MINSTFGITMLFTDWFIFLLGYPSKQLSYDDYERMLLCLKVLSENNAPIVKIFNTDCRNALANMLVAQQNEEYSLIKVYI